jgi:hypothetical protein
LARMNDHISSMICPASHTFHPRSTPVQTHRLGIETDRADKIEEFLTS